MRSFALKPALAALILSTSIAGAFAAPGIDASSDGREAPIPNPMVTQGYGTGDYAAAPEMAGRGRVAVAPPAAYRPRLAAVVRELGTADHRMNVDRGRGYLTAAEFGKVRGEEQAIRHQAFATADRHGGRIPAATFVALQKEIGGLNRTIHRYAVNS